MYTYWLKMYKNAFINVFIKEKLYTPTYINIYAHLKKKCIHA